LYQKCTGIVLKDLQSNITEEGLHYTPSPPFFSLVCF